MNWNDLLTALALVMVVEGIMPFASPRKYKSTMQQMLSMPDSTLRSIGFGLMLIGVISLFLVR